MTELSNRILARLRSKGDRVIRMVDLVGLSDKPERRGRDVDQTLQRMRKRGEIAYDSKAGWLLMSELAFHHVDGNPSNNDKSNLHVVRISENLR